VTIDPTLSHHGLTPPLKVKPARLRHLYGCPPPCCPCRVCASPDPTTRVAALPSASLAAASNVVIEYHSELPQRACALSPRPSLRTPFWLTHVHADHILASMTFRPFISVQRSRAPRFTATNKLFASSRVFALRFSFDDKPTYTHTYPIGKLYDIQHPSNCSAFPLIPLALLHGGNGSSRGGFSLRGRAAYSHRFQQIPFRFSCRCSKAR